MQLIIKNQQVNKVYKGDGTLEGEDIQSINYEIKEGDNVVGNANVYGNNNNAKKSEVKKEVSRNEVIGMYNIIGI